MNGPPQFQPGDEVEFDMAYMSHAESPAIPVRGRIIAIDGERAEVKELYGWAGFTQRVPLERLRLVKRAESQG